MKFLKILVVVLLFGACAHAAADWTAPALRRGWNFVGYVEGKVNWGEDAVVWGWKGSRFEIIKPAELQEGVGYWVYVGK